MWWGVGILAALGLIWSIFFRTPEQKLATIIIEPKEFLQQVSVSGTVVAARDVDLGFSQGGRVSRVYAKVGDRVSQGVVLAEVENADLRASVSQQQASLEREQARLAALKAGTRPEEIALKQAAVDADKADLVDAVQDAYRAADGAVHTTLDQMFDNPRYAPLFKPTISDTTLKYKVESGRTGAESMLAQWGAESLSLTASGDLAFATGRAQSNLASIASLLSDVSAALSRAIPTTQSPQATIDVYANAVASARTDINAAVSAVNAASASLSTSQKNLTLAQAGTSAQDIAAQEASVKAAEASVLQAQAQLQKTLIVAPFAGTVTVVEAKVGALASSNISQVSMISTGAFQLESYVPEVNIALLHAGDKATVALDAYGDETTFAASVAAIDPASTMRDGVSTYRILLQFGDVDPRIRVGMTANITIDTLKKEGVLSVPQGAVLARQGKKYLRLQEGGAVVEREISTGALSSLGEVEILAGLSAGDIVVLSKQ